MPDDALLDLAVAGRLHDPKVMTEQVTRMLGDPEVLGVDRELFEPVAPNKNLEAG